MKKKSASPTSEDEQAIQATADAFTRAYNSGNAAAIAIQFTPDGELVGEDGAVVRGRKAIEAEFAEIFAEDSERTIEISINSIRFLGGGIAIEDGKTKVMTAPGKPPQRNRYTAIHVKSDSGWLVASVRDAKSQTLSNYERLKPLEWMVGEWVDEGQDSLVLTTVRWTKNRSYLIREFSVQIEGRPVMNGTQRIGWDPLTEQIKSWVFDTEGGYGEGLWSRDGDGWIVKASGVRRDGRIGSATNIISPINNDAYRWESVDRLAAGEVLPDIQVTIVRKPPMPE